MSPLKRRPIQVLCARLCACLCACLPLGAAAGIVVEIDGVDGEQQQALLASMEISHYRDSEVSAAKARRLFERAKEQAATALQAYGYYDVSVSGDIEQSGADWQASFQVERGDPVVISEVNLDVGDAPAELDPVKHALQSFHPRTGEVLDHARYEKSKSALQAALTETGFLDARMTTHRVAVSLADKRASIDISFEPGPRYRFGQTLFEDSQFRDGFLQRYVPWDQGDFFSQSDLLSLQRQLVDTGYFAIVQVEPNMDNAADGTIPILVHLTRAKRSLYTGGPFFGTDTGFGVQGGVTRRWVNDRGHTANLHVLIAQRLKTANITYHIPLGGEYQRSFNFGLDLRREDTVTSSSETLSMVANETRIWHGYRRTLGVRLLTGDFKIAGEKRNSTLLFPELTLLKKVGNHPLFVRNGWSVRGTARAGYEDILTDTSFAELTLDAKWIHSLNTRNRLIFRGVAGAMWVDDFTRLPPELRYFAGGSRSIRGYDFEAIGPRNAADLVIGGENVLVASAEIEHYFTDEWGMAAFVDAGDAFTGTDFDTKLGAGLGLRWQSPVGMVRVDLALPINDPFESGVHLHVVIGPDL